MADNVAYTPGAGATIAADEIGGVLHQRVKTQYGDDGQATDVSETNPLPVVISQGELLEALEALRLATNALTRSVGHSHPDVAGRLRVALDSISASLTLATITTVGTVTTVTGVTTVTTVGTVTNQSNMGGVAANEHVPALMSLAVTNLRSQIVVT